jgi:hypothetical protein
MLRSGTANYGSGRLLASLKWAGVTHDRDGMFIVPRNIPRAIVGDLELLCAKDERFDWKFGDEAA